MPPYFADRYPPGFEEDDRLRSDFIRDLTLLQLQADHKSLESTEESGTTPIPRTLVRFWDDPAGMPIDVQKCVESWAILQDDGVEFRMFNDVSAAAFIDQRFGHREVAAFASCRHPAMRSDYLRLCFLVEEGGLYVDTDDVLLGGGWEAVFRGHTLKVQPLGYDLTTRAMIPAAELRRPDLPRDGRIFYVNNNPIAAPAGHPVLQRALRRATDRLLGSDPAPEIQSTTGPGNLTAALAGHERERQLCATPAVQDFRLLVEWERVSEPRWELSYRDDDRNWRNMGQS